MHRRLALALLVLLLLTGAGFLIAPYVLEQDEPPATTSTSSGSTAPPAPTLQTAGPEAAEGNHAPDALPPAARDACVVAGRVRRGSQAVAGVPVVLRVPLRVPPRMWSLRVLSIAASGATDAKGAFRVPVPPGAYVLQVGTQPHAWHRPVVAPTDTDLDIDLGSGGRITVTVHGPAAKPVARAIASVRAADGRARVASAGVDGSATFDDLPPGTYTPAAAPPLGQTAFATEGAAVELTPAGDESAVVVLSAATLAGPPRPRRMRVVVAGTSDFEGWQARAMYRGTTDWRAVNVERAVRIIRGIDVKAPDGRRWMVRATDAELAVGLLELPTSEVLWRGQLLERTTNRPLVGYTVFARPAASLRAWIGSTTDAAGEFEVRVARGPDLVLTFSDPKDERLRGVSFAVKQASTSTSSRVQVRLPLPDAKGRFAFPVRRLAGTVRRKDGTPPPAKGDIDSMKGGMIQVSARYEEPDGVLLLGTPTRTTGLSASGRYALDVYEAESYVAWVYTEMTKAGRAGRTDAFEWVGSAATQDFELD